jgi:predicted TIM-barrel fold metal-dependent hydrolase
VTGNRNSSPGGKIREKAMGAQTGKNPDRYILISADGHAGANIPDYRAYLPKSLHAEFDAWAATFRDPWVEYDNDLADTDDANLKIGVASSLSVYNWDSEKRIAHQDEQGIAAEVLFPNTVPPFYPSGSITASAPTNEADYRYQWAGMQAHNRWMVDFCAKAPGRRAGLAQVFLSNLDDAIAEVRWAKKAGLAGVIIPSDHMNLLVNLFERRLDPFWAVCSELGLPVHRHTISVGPVENENTGPAAVALGAHEAHSLFQRWLAHLMFGGVFQRFPELQFVFTETGSAWVTQELRRLDWSMKLGKIKGQTAYPLYHRAAEQLDMLPSEYFKRNMQLGISLAVRRDLDARHEIGVEKLMWGADYPHHEGCFPHTTLALRLLFSDIPENEVRQITSLNAARVYGLDLAKLQTIADKIGPAIDEIAKPVQPDELPNASLGHTVSEAIEKHRASIAAE